MFTNVLLQMKKLFTGCCQRGALYDRVRLSRGEQKKQTLEMRVN